MALPFLRPPQKSNRGQLAKTSISLKFTRVGDIIGIMTERFFGWTFPAPGPDNRRETYPMEIIGIFADKVVWKGVEINPGKAGRFLTGPDGLQGELSAPRERLNPGSRWRNSLQATPRRLI